MREATKSFDRMGKFPTANRIRRLPGVCHKRFHCNQVCTNPRRQFATATKFCTVASLICGYGTWFMSSFWRREFWGGCWLLDWYDRRLNSEKGRRIWNEKARTLRHRSKDIWWLSTDFVFPDMSTLQGGCSENRVLIGSRGRIIFLFL